MPQVSTTATNPIRSPPIFSSFSGLRYSCRLLRSQWKLRRRQGKCSGAERRKGGQLVRFDLANLHVGVDLEGWISYGRAFRRWGMLRGDEKVRSSAKHLVGVTVALRALHGHRTRRNQLVERNAVAIEGNIRPLGLRNLQQIVADAR